MAADVIEGRERWALLEGDCADILPTLPDECADAVCVDPPYGIGFTFAGEKEQASNPADYWTWLGPIVAEMLRCLKPGGFFACWQSQLYFRHFWDWFGPDIHIYCAAKNFVQLRPTLINYGYDPVVMFYKPGGEPLRPEDPARSIDFYVANTAGVISDPERLERGHPCPKPLDLMRTILDNFVLPGGLVLDGFTGSGSTGVAAIQTGRRFIGIERAPEYVAIARARLESKGARHTKGQIALLDVA